MQRLFVLNFGIQLLLIGVVVFGGRCDLLLASIPVLAGWWIGLDGLEWIFDILSWWSLFGENINDKALLGFPGVPVSGLPFLLLLFLFLPFLLVDECLEFAKKLDAEKGDKDGNEDVGNDRRKDIIEEGANSRPENCIGDDYHHDVVVD